MSNKELDEMTEDMNPWWKGPLKYILGVGLILILVLWFIPISSIKLDPSPKNIPDLVDVVPKDIVVEEEVANQITMDMVNGGDPIVKEVADKIVVESCKDKGKACQAKALFYFVRDNFEYINDPTAYEYVKTARQSLASGGGDCDDASVLLGSLLDAIGIRIRFVFIPGHVYVQAYIPEALKKYKEEGDLVNLDGACSYCEFGEISWKSVGKEERVLN